MSEARVALPAKAPALNRWTLVIWALVILSSFVIRHSSLAADPVSFSRDIRPILSQHCFKCHGTDQQKSRLRLDDRAVATRPAKSGETPIVPGQPGASELLRRVTSKGEDEVMPPPKENKPLTAGQIEKLRQWIAGGAVYETHWAYVKPVRPPVPVISGAVISHQSFASGKRITDYSNPIDAFVAARLQKEGLHPSPEADRHTLIRRVSLDLTGLPPTLAEVDAFVKDRSPGAYEKEVDRLLASERYGERWARPWLDLARYGDSAGYQHDMEMPLWLYRDWVIRAFNADMPFDRFTIEQLAGDLVPQDPNSQNREPILATGFSRCATATLGADNDAEELRAQLIWDRVNTFATTWLGASLECAQCHNHKFDPFTQRDYYSLFAYFNRTAPELTFYFGDHYYITGGVLELPIPPEQRAKLDAVRREITAQFDAIEAQLKDGNDDNVPPTIRRLLISPRENRTPERIAYLFVDELNKGQKVPASVKNNIERVKQLARDLDRLRAPRSLVLEEDRTPPVTHVLLRGNIKTPGEEVAPGIPAALHPLPKDAPPNRLGLAQWVVSRDNPLTARVMVNRWWAEFFGIGIVPTPEDFGLQGELPTHPELLDWLAVEFMEGRSAKHIHKLIVMSATYRQSSRSAEFGMRNAESNAANRRASNNVHSALRTPHSAFQIDPQNRLLARGPRARLDAESLRDNVLAIAGLLQNEPGGRPVAATREAAENDEPFEYRRSIYVRHQRGAPYATFATFDAPDRFACTARRARSNTPLQALTLLNEPVFVEAAQALATRVLSELPGASARERAARMFRLCLARPPQPPELAELEELHAKKLAGGGSEPEAWFLVANVLLNLDETITKE